MTDPNIATNGDLVLTAEEVEEIPRRVAALMAWYFRRYPNLSKSLSPQRRGRYAGAFRQLCQEFCLEDVRAICAGIFELFPYNAEGGRQMCSPFAILKRAPEALIVGRERLEARRRSEELLRLAKANPIRRPPMRTPTPEQLARAEVDRARMLARHARRQGLEQ